MARPTDVGVSVAVLIFDAENRVLLSQRLGDRNESGAWGTPGGWVERRDGHLKVAAAREVFEEAGIDARGLRIVSASLHDTPRDFAYVAVWVACFAPDWLGELSRCEPDKHGPWGWFSLDEMPQPLVPGTWKMALRALEERVADR